jgi:hypothetical protein
VGIFSFNIESEETIAVGAIDLIPVSHSRSAVLEQFGAMWAPDFDLVVDHVDLDFGPSSHARRFPTVKLSIYAINSSAHGYRDVAS